MIGRFFRGLTSLPRGAVFYLRNPTLWGVGLVPVAISIVVFLGCAIGLYFGVDWLVEVLQGIPGPERPELATQGFWVGLGHYLKMAGYWMVFAGHWTLTHLPQWLFFMVFGAVFLVFMWVAFVVVVNSVGGPWNDALSARVEALVKGTPFVEDATPLRQKFSDLGRGVLHSLIRLTLYLTVAVILAIINAASGGIGTAIVIPLQILWSIFFMALEFADIPDGRRDKTLKEKFHTVGSNKAAMLGFGAATYFVLLVPIVNIFSIPFAVTGMTLLYLEEVES